MELLPSRITNAVHWIWPIPAPNIARHVYDDVFDDNGRRLFRRFHRLRHINRPIAQCLEAIVCGEVLVSETLHDLSQVANGFAQAYLRLL